MSERNSIDDRRSAQITERIGETFDFMRDVLDDPAILDEIPAGAEIELRTVTIGDHAYRIVAYRSESDRERWIARTTGRLDQDLARGRRFWVSIRLHSDVSAQAAMNSVESALKAADETDQLAHRIA